MYVIKNFVIDYILGIRFFMYKNFFMLLSFLEFKVYLSFVIFVFW